LFNQVEKRVMVKIIELAGGEQPQGERYVLVLRDGEARNPYGTILIDHGRGMTLAVPFHTQGDEDWWFRTWQAKNLAERHGIGNVFVQR
jgi:hypothetical protein